MSSLQQRAFGASFSASAVSVSTSSSSPSGSGSNNMSRLLPTPTPAPTPTPKHNNHSSTTFESCFSAGLDLTEFGGVGAPPFVAASANLAKEKLDAAERTHREEKEEAALERRIEHVVECAAAKSSLFSSNNNSATARSNTHVVVAPRALHPGRNATNNNSAVVGNGRDDNFIQFQKGASINATSGSLLSSLLVSNHQSEERLGNPISHKSRTTLKKLKKSQHQIMASSSRQSSSLQKKQERKSPKHTATKRGVAAAKKKSRKSKY